MKKGKFDFEDYLESMKQMRKMGGLVQYFEYDARDGDQRRRSGRMPIDEKQMARMEAIVLSMTIEERQNPKLLKSEQKAPDRKGRRRGHRRCKPSSSSSLNRVKKMMKQLPGMMGGKGRRGFGGFGGMKLPFEFIYIRNV